MTKFIESVRAIALSGIAHSEPAADVLAAVCTELERHLPGTVVGVTILDRAAQIFEHAIFPSLSPAYAEALAGAVVAEKPGTCALAVFDGRTVSCMDVAADGRFSEGWKELSLEHGLRALMSIPAMHREGIALGTLVVAFAPEKPLGEADLALADEVAAICGLILTYRRAQLAHELLVGELQHRMRNVFSTIGAVVYSTLRSHPQPETFREAFDGRLMALAKAHSLAIDPTETDLRRLLSDLLAPYSLDHHIVFEGPRILLSRDAAVAFSLATHELATNAAKYGAFAAEGGAVRVGWRVAEGDEGNYFTMTWQEEGGPPVAEPSRQGYGQTTVRRSLEAAIDAKVALEYRPDGLRCVVSAPNSARLGTVVH